MRSKNTFPDLTGQIFGRLTVLKQERRNVTCICVCGNPKVASKYDVERGFVKSCGCAHRDVLVARNKGGATHGLSKEGVGVSWQAIMTRCFNKANHTYAEYGGRGITACEFIRATPVNLLLLLGGRPPRLSVDRIRNNDSYTCGRCAECLANGWPLNVRWATRTEQGRNQRTNRLIEIGGVTKCVTAWEEHAGLTKGCVRARLAQGVTGRALLLPPKPSLRLITINGVTKRLTEWARETGINVGTLSGRLADGDEGGYLIRPVVHHKWNVAIDGVNKPVATWAKEHGLEGRVILHRLARGITGRALLAATGR